MTKKEKESRKILIDYCKKRSEESGIIDGYYTKIAEGLAEGLEN